MDVALFEPAVQSESLVLSTETASSTFHAFQGVSRIRTLNVTLGTGVTYSLVIAGTNLTSSIRYDNKATIGQIGDDNLDYRASGTVLVTLTEHVSMTSNLDIGIEGPSMTAFLDINLQDGVEGELFIGSTLISFLDRVGWTWDGVNSFNTVSGSPDVIISVYHCDHIYANLLN